jgi:hypothetical protein
MIGAVCDKGGGYYKRLRDDAEISSEKRGNTSWEDAQDDDQWEEKAN